MKNGRMLYCTDLADAISKLANIDFKQRKADSLPKSVSVGTYSLQLIDKDTQAAVISF